MSENVAQHMLSRLADGWGVRRVFAYPGDGINGFLGAFDDLQDKIEFTQTRHEEIASFAASAHAKLTDEAGVCMATSGPGAIHLLNGLYDAKLDHQPVVAIIGQQKRMSLGANYQQEVDLQVLFKDVASEFCQYCMAPEQAELLIDRAMRVALASRSVTCVIVPSDVQEAAWSPPPLQHGAVFSAPGITRPHVTPREEDLLRAAEIINGARKPAILIGQGAREARAEVEQLADLIGGGVAKALNGRDALPDDLPYVTGPIGLLGSTASHHMVTNCDAFIMIGTSFPYSEWLPEPGSVPAVQIDIDGRLIGSRYPVDVQLVGDSRDALQALLPHLRRNEDRSWREELEGEILRWWDILAGRAELEADPVNPEHVFHALSSRLPDRAILTADSGSATNWWARHLRVRDGMRAALSGTLATMCPSIPYALGAKFAHPDRPVVACLGDGAMQMLGINALIDVARYYERWANRQLVIVVLNNQDLNQVTWEQRVMAGDPKFEGSQSLPDFPYAQYAELLGLDGVRIERREQVEAGLDEAMESDRPCLVEVISDPEVPPLPPHITVDQAKKMTKALLERDPHAGRIVKQAAKGKLQEFLNR